MIYDIDSNKYSKERSALGELNFIIGRTRIFLVHIFFNFTLSSLRRSEIVLKNGRILWETLYIHSDDATDEFDGHGAIGQTNRPTDATVRPGHSA